MATTTQITALATTLGISVNANEALQMNAVQGKGACTLTLQDTNCQYTAALVQTAIRSGDTFDKAVCFGLNYLYVQNVHKSDGAKEYKTFAAFGEALTGYNPDTVNSYRAIGEIFLDANGNAKRDYVKRLSIAHLNQLKSFFGSASTYHCGAKVDHDFLEALFANYPHISVSATNKLIKVLKNGQLDASLVDAIVDKDGEDGADIVKYFIKGSNVELPFYKPVQETKDGEDGADGKDTANAKKVLKNGQLDADTPKDPFVLLADAVTAMETLTMDEDTAKAWKGLSKKIMAFVTEHATLDTKDGADGANNADK